MSFHYPLSVWLFSSSNYTWELQQVLHARTQWFSSHFQLSVIQKFSFNLHSYFYCVNSYINGIIYFSDALIFFIYWRDYFCLKSYFLWICCFSKLSFVCIFAVASKISKSSIDQSFFHLEHFHSASFKFLQVPPTWCGHWGFCQYYRYLIYNRFCKSRYKDIKAT